MKKLVTIFALFLFFSSNIRIFANEYGWGLKPETNNVIPNPGSQYLNLIKGHDTYYVGKDEPNIYLTFDLGYESGSTSRILDTLKKNNTTAAFFVTGHYLRDNPELVKRMFDEGHLVCNHTESHRNLSILTKEEIKKELEDVEKIYTQITGSQMPKYVRPPKGVINEESLQTLDDLGYKNILWSLAYNDWNRDVTKGADYAFNTVTSRIHNGAIILLHACSEDNTNALDRIIIDLKDKGYIFSSLDEL